MRKIATAILCLVILCWGAQAFNNKSEGSSPQQPFQAVHPNNFFDSRYFTWDKSTVAEDLHKKIYGVVVPHHLVAYKLIGQVFEKLEVQKPELLIIIGPNHYNQGERIITSTWGWETPFGTVESDVDVVNYLVENSLVKVEDDVFGAEHSMGNLMPFIKYYLPEARVVPLIFHHDLTRDEAGILGQQLADLVTEKEAVIMGSIDFSHYLTNLEAQKKDAETLEVLKSRNISRLLTLGSEHLDSPGAMATLILAMERLGIQDFNVLENTNSGQLIGNDLIETTSYFTLIYGR